MKSQYFLTGKELDESIVNFPKLWLILFVIPLFLLIRYLILSQILLNNPYSNNIKYWILLSRDATNLPI